MSIFRDYNKPVIPPALPLGPRGPSSSCGGESSPVSENFSALLEKEIGAVPFLGLTVEVFVERVNATHGLRYYFQEPTDTELSSLGLKRQGYWLRARSGSENFIVSLPRVAAVLQAAHARFGRER